MVAKKVLVWYKLKDYEYNFNFFKLTKLCIELKFKKWTSNWYHNDFLSLFGLLLLSSLELFTSSSEITVVLSCFSAFTFSGDLFLNSYMPIAPSRIPSSPKNPKKGHNGESLPKIFRDFD